MLKYNELNFATVANRNSMERPEGLDTGSIVLTGLNTKTIIDSISLVLYEKDNSIEREWADDYKVLNTSMRVVKLIMGTSKLSNKWNGIEVR